MKHIKKLLIKNSVYILVHNFIQHKDGKNNHELKCMCVWFYGEKKLIRSELILENLFGLKVNLRYSVLCLDKSL